MLWTVSQYEYVALPDRPHFSLARLVVVRPVDERSNVVALCAEHPQASRPWRAHTRAAFIQQAGAAVPGFVRATRVQLHSEPRYHLHRPGRATLDEAARPESIDLTEVV